MRFSSREMDFGNPPVKLLCDRFNVSSRDRSLMSEGIVPVKSLSLRLRAMRLSSCENRFRQPATQVIASNTYRLY